MSAVTRRLAAELAPLLDRALEGSVGIGGNEQPLRDLLWENKVGILRALEAHGAEICDHCFQSTLRRERATDW